MLALAAGLQVLSWRVREKMLMINSVWRERYEIWDGDIGKKLPLPILGSLTGVPKMRLTKARLKEKKRQKFVNVCI